MNADKQYRSFHGHAPRGKRRLKLPDIRELVELGDAVEIVYRCKKLNGGGDGKTAEYQHKFARGAKLYCTPAGVQILIVHGPKIRIREPGIIN